MVPSRTLKPRGIRRVRTMLCTRWSSQRVQRLQRLPRILDRARVTRANRRDRLSVDGLGKEGGRSQPKHDAQLQLVRGLPGEVAERAEDVLRPLPGIEAEAATRSGPTSCSSYSNEVTIPKFPPPPRRAHRSSGFSVSLARTNFPSAVTTSAETKLSHVSPCLC